MSQLPSGGESDIPAEFQGDLIVVVAEMDGEPIVASGKQEPNLLIGDDQTPFSSLPVLARIVGVSDEAAERITVAVENYHPEIGVPIMPITRSTLLKVLAGEGDN